MVRDKYLEENYNLLDGMKRYLHIDCDYLDGPAYQYELNFSRFK
jgi:hypothetical protein